jgi:putative transposase
MAAYANWLGEYGEMYGVQIHGWVLMTNHVHLLMTPQSEFGISTLMQTLGRLYVRYFNYGYHRSGTLFEGRYKSSVVQQEQYLLCCQRYIELNPVRAAWSEIRVIIVGPVIALTHLDLSRVCGRPSHYTKL